MAKKNKSAATGGGANFNGELPWFPGNPWHIGGPPHDPGQLTSENHPPPIALDPVFDPPFALVSAETMATGGGGAIFNHELPWILFLSRKMLHCLGFCGSPKNDKPMVHCLTFFWFEKIKKPVKSMVHCFAFSGSKKSIVHWPLAFLVPEKISESIVNGLRLSVLEKNKQIKCSFLVSERIKQVDPEFLWPFWISKNDKPVKSMVHCFAFSASKKINNSLALGFSGSGKNKRIYREWPSLFCFGKNKQIKCSFLVSERIKQVNPELLWPFWISKNNKQVKSMVHCCAFSVKNQSFIALASLVHCGSKTTSKSILPCFGFSGPQRGQANQWFIGPWFFRFQKKSSVHCLGFSGSKKNQSFIASAILASTKQA